MIAIVLESPSRGQQEEISSNKPQNLNYLVPIATICHPVVPRGYITHIAMQTRHISIFYQQMYV